MNVKELFTRASVAMKDPAEISPCDAELLTKAISGESLSTHDMALAKSIARALVNGAYKAADQLFMRTSNLGMTGSESGFVHYRGIHAEHFSYSTTEDTNAALQHLAENCKNVLDKGYMLTARSAICPLHESAPGNGHLAVAMTTVYCLFTKDEQVAGVFNRLEHEGMLILVSDGKGGFVQDPVVLGAYEAFHHLQGNGWKAQTGNSFEKFEGFMNTLAVSDEELSRMTGYEFARI